MIKASSNMTDSHFRRVKEEELREDKQLTLKTLSYEKKFSLQMLAAVNFLPYSDRWGESTRRDFER